MSTADDLKADFCLKIDFERGAENPARVFRAMSELIEAMSFLDQELVGAIDPRIKPVILLEDVETGSIKAWLKQVIQQVPDDALQNLEWQPVVGQYLVKAKYLVIDFLAKTTEITDATQFSQLSAQIQQAAEETDVKSLPVYAQPSIKGLMDATSRIGTALSPLGEKDRASFITGTQEASFNLKLALSPESIEKMLTKRSFVHQQVMILKVKRPDYLGDAQWEFRHGKQVLRAKIEDRQWLGDFQARKVDVRPGDALEAKIELCVNYGLDEEVISTTYRILEVLDVKPDNHTSQQKLDYQA